MQKIAWNDERNWQKIVIKKEVQQLSIAFIFVYLAALLVALATGFPLRGISFLVLFLYIMGLCCVIAENWHFYHYEITKDGLEVFDRRDKVESIAIDNSTISSIKHFESFNLVRFKKNTNCYSVYISSDSEEWEILKALWKLPTTI